MKKTRILITILMFLSFAGVVRAADPLPATSTEYLLLAPIPFVQSQVTATGTYANATTYLPGLFRLAIGLAGLLAVVRLIYAGIKYMSTDAFGEKSEAKGIIENALWGLGLAIAAWIILYTINPKLVEINFNIERQKVSAPIAPPSPAGGGTGTGGGGTEGGGGGTTIPLCTTCEDVRVNHKLAPNGCRLPAGQRCQIDASLNAKLDLLDRYADFLVTEMFPPTRQHKDPCHVNAICVDATISNNTPANIKRFIIEARDVGLRAVYEVTDESRAESIRRQGGLSREEVIAVGRKANGDPWISGEHFSIYKQ